MRKGFSVSATIEALQFLIPCALCDELMVIGDDSLSRCVSLVVKFNIWLNKTKSTNLFRNCCFLYHRTKQQETTKKHPDHDMKTAEQLLILFFFSG